MSTQSELEFAERMKKVRELRGLSVEKVASYVGVTPNTYKKYEEGSNKQVRVDRLGKISIALNCSPAYIMRWHDDYSKYFYPLHLEKEERYLIVSKDMLVRLEVYPEELESFKSLHINTDDDLTDEEVLEAYNTMKKLKSKA